MVRTEFEFIAHHPSSVARPDSIIPTFLEELRTLRRLKCSARICRHGCPTAGCNRPVVDPLPPNAISSFEQLTTWLMPVFHHNDDSSVEFSLGVINVGAALPFGGDDVLNA